MEITNTLKTSKVKHCGASTLTGLLRPIGLATIVISAVLLFIVPPPASAGAHKAQTNDFPTYARAEYVFICMSSNGASEYVLRQCSCAIDEIAKRMTFDEYVGAETAVRMRQMRGEKASQFREVEVIRKSIKVLRAAQAEAEIACF